MKRIGLLGGAFNPVHLGHLNMAQTALEKMKLDEVIFIPSYISPHKSSKGLISSSDRLKMLRLALTENNYFSVNNIELKRRGVSYSIDTVKEIIRRSKEQIKIYFIIGEDNYQTLNKWKNIDGILKLVEFIVVNREGYQGKKDINVRFVDMAALNLSSSLIRKSVASDKSIQYYVPQNVYRYIKKNNLYLN